MSTSSSGELRQIPLDLIDPDPSQPRRDFPEDGGMEKSVGALGVIQPILVKAVDRGRYRIIDGECRWRGARAAGRKDISAIVTVDDRDPLLVQLAANVQRHALSPFDEAEAYRRALAADGMTQAKLAEFIGVSRSHIAKSLMLLDAMTEVRVAMTRDPWKVGLLSPAAANEVMRLRILDRFQTTAEADCWPNHYAHRILWHANARTVDDCRARVDYVLGCLNAVFCAEHSKRLPDNVQRQTSDLYDLIVSEAQRLEGVGRALMEVKGVLPDDQFAPWLKAELGWAEEDVRDFMQEASVYDVVAVGFISRQLKPDFSKITPAESRLLADAAGRSGWN